MLRAYGVSDRGRVRATNEDHFAIDEQLRLLVVADGMGGHNAGEVAARLAVEAIVDFVRESRERDPSARGDTWPFGFDPALTAGPFETALQDVLGVTIFLGLATALLRWLA